MTSFKFVSPFFANIHSISHHEITNTTCTIHINNKKQTFAISFSSYICQMLKVDPLMTDIYIDNNLLDDIQDIVYDKLLSLLDFKEIQLENKEISQIAKLAKVLGNDELFELYKNMVKDIEQNMNENNVISIVQQKISLDIPIEEMDSEISFISSKFTVFIDQLIELGKEDKYMNLIECNVRHENLQLHTEDELLMFIIKLCEENGIYDVLFQYVWLEYYTVETIKHLINYINENICHDYHMQSIFKCINRRLIQEKIPLQQKDQKRYSNPFSNLIEECKKGNLDKLQLLVNDENINQQDENGKNLIYCACEYGHLPIVKYLVSKGCDPICRQKNKNTPVHIASIKGHLPIIEYFIETLDIDKDIKGYNNCIPLHGASECGHLSIVKYLISKGSNPISKNNDGNSPIHFASKLGRLPIVEYFIDTVHIDKDVK